MIEITNDVRFLLPIMLSVMTAKWVADFLTHSLYHAIIELKCLPFLNPEISLHGAKDGDLEKHTITDLIGHDMVVQTIREESETAGSVARLLLETQHGAYPVVDGDGYFKGTITRSTLIFILGRLEQNDTSEPKHADIVAAEASDRDPVPAMEMLQRCLNKPELSKAKVDIAPYINSSAFSLRANFSLHRTYMLFRTMGLRHLVIVSHTNKVVGIITRKDLMDFRLHSVLHPHGHDDGHGSHGALVVQCA